MRYGYVISVILLAVMVVIPSVVLASDNRVTSEKDSIWHELKAKALVRPTGWWSHWSGDKNSNCVGDTLEGRNPNEVTAVYAVFPSPPTNSQVSYIASKGYDIVYKTKYTNALCIENIHIGDVPALALSPGVVVVQEQSKIYPTLDVSVPSIRATESQIYTKGVWEDLGITGEGVSVAIIDSGVDDGHPALEGKYLMGVDFSHTGVIVYQNPDDKEGHGTHCAGIVMSQGDDSGTPKGVAPDANLIDLKVINNLGDTFADKIVMALEWCMDNMTTYNIRVASMSLGGKYTSDGTGVEADTVNQAAAMGIIPVAASGNDGELGLIPTPAAADGAICVGATDDQNTISRDDDIVADYSNGGPRPSDNDGNPYDELKPDIVAPGTNIKSCKNSYSNQQGWGTIEMSGTSMATPHVSGVCALMAEAYPGITTEDARTILHQTAEKRGNPDYPNLSNKYNRSYGYGILDAYGAVARAKDLNSLSVSFDNNVQSRDTVKFTATTHYTITSYNEGGEEVAISARIPDTFTRPSSISIAYDGNLQYITNIDAPVRSNGMWELTGRLQFNPGGADDDGTVSLEFQTDAPQNPGDYSTNFSVSIGGVQGADFNRSITVISQQADKPDFSIVRSGISFSPESPQSGDNVTITARVNNSGTVSSQCDVKFYDGVPSSNTEIGGTTINVPAGGYSYASVQWTASSGVHTIHVIADPDNAVDESNEFNNSASKTINVGGGVNIPPVASLSADPTTAAIGETVTFDGSKSSDVDGNVVYYKFDFGDDTTTDWVEDSVVTHTYTTEGKYKATLKVKDNGGQESTNTAKVNITIQAGKPYQMYLRENFKLKTEAPNSMSEDTVNCPRGNLGPIGGLLEWKEVGVWTADVFSGTILDTTVSKLWLRNDGNKTPTVLSLRGRITLNGKDISSTDTQAVRLLGTGETAQVNLSMDMNAPTEVTTSDTLGFKIECLTDGDGINLLYNGLNYPSDVIFIKKVEPESPPVANAGEDKTVYVNETVTFQGTGTDTDGTIVKYEWDFDGDGVWDYSGASGTAQTKYTSPGSYTAKLRVTDNDGLTDTDSANVKVVYQGQNKPPQVTISSPANGTNVSGKIEIQGTSSDMDGKVSRVDVKIGDSSWEAADGTSDWTYTWDTRELDNGVYRISARSYDGIDYSQIQSIEVIVNNVNYAPVILSTSIFPPLVSNDGTSVVQIAVSVSDKNGYDDISGVFADLHEFQMSSKEPLFDDGNHGDTGVQDGIFGISFTVPTTISEGTYTIPIWVVDSADARADDSLNIVVQSVNYAPEVISVNVDPDSVSSPTKVTITAEVSDDNGPEDIESVTIDLSSLGLASDEKMYDDGTNGDETADDGVYTIVVYVTDEMEKGTHTLKVTVQDKSGETADGEADLIITHSAKKTAQNTPGFEAIGTVIALASVALIFSSKKKWPF